MWKEKKRKKKKSAGNEPRLYESVGGSTQITLKSTVIERERGEGRVEEEGEREPMTKSFTRARSSLQIFHVPWFGANATNGNERNVVIMIF